MITRRPAPLIALLALLLALGAVAVPSVARIHKTADAPASDQAQRFSVSGTVQAVDYDANSVTISSSGKLLEVAITPTTAIEDRGQVGSIADVHRGRKITASGVIRAGRMVAQSVKLH